MKEHNSQNRDSSYYEAIDTTDANVLPTATSPVSHVYIGGDGIPIDVDSSSSTVSPPHFASYDFYSSELPKAESVYEPLLRGETDQALRVPTLYDDQHLGVAGAVDPNNDQQFSANCDDYFTPTLGDGRSQPSRISGDDSADPLAYQYWYGRTPNMTAPYPSVCYSGDGCHKPISRYTAYVYAPQTQYYQASPSSYNGYIPERKGSYRTTANTASSYNMQESFLHGKTPYPVPPSTRNNSSWSGIQAGTDMSPMACYNMSPERMSYKGWIPRVSPGNNEHLTSGTMPQPMMQGMSSDVLPPQLDQHFEAETFYNELSVRLQHELKKKTTLGSAGRPKMNRNNYSCAICNVKSTPQWRYIKGTSVCNACYMRIRKQKMKRIKQEKEVQQKSGNGSADTEVAEDVINKGNTET